MADPTAGYPKDSGEQDGYVKECRWTLTTADPKGTAIKMSEYSDITWNMLKTGTTEGGSTLTVETSPVNVDADFAPCKNVAGGAAIGVTAAPAAAVSIERAVYIRPRLNPAGSGATVIVHATLRRPNPMRQ